MKEADLLQFFYECSQEPLYKQLGLVEYFLDESFWEPVISSENYFHNIDNNTSFIVSKED